MYDDATIARFWARVDKSGGPDACWPWTGSSNGRYGTFATPGHHATTATRFLMELTHGPFEAGIEVLHICDNPICVNPAHLRCGSHRDNMRDAAGKGRMRTGGENGHAKLTEHQVVSIREMYHYQNWTQEEIAAHFKVSNCNVSEIVNNLLWQSAGGPRSGHVASRRTRKQAA